MKKNIKKYGLLSFISFCLLSCYSDKGNYDYHDINEITISNIEETYTILQGVDNLHVEPIIEGTMDKNGSEDYSYKWELNKTVISEEKVLDHISDLPKGNYTLYCKVIDKESGVEWKQAARVSIIYPFTTGFILATEDKEGYAQMDMIGMPTGKDTVILKNLLADSEMPKVKGAKFAVHTGGISSKNAIKLWLIGDDGAYYADPITFLSGPNNNIKSYIYSAMQRPADFRLSHIGPNTNDGTGNSGRILRCNNGWIFRTTLIEGEAYGNPLNYIPEESLTRFNTAPYLIYSAVYYSFSFMIYDTDNERFVKVDGEGDFCVGLEDGEASPVFPWNNKEVGRTLKYVENTKNTDGGSTNGNSFAIMQQKSGDLCWIYKFYPFTVKKIGGYDVKPIATDFATASMYAFSSSRTVLFYAKGSKLYAYDYNPGNEKKYEFDLGGDEITMLKFDIQSKDNNSNNNLYIATYNSATGGTLTKYMLGTDPDNVTITKDPKAVWTGLNKIKNMDWRNN